MKSKRHEKTKKIEQLRSIKISLEKSRSALNEPNQTEACFDEVHLPDGTILKRSDLNDLKISLREKKIQYERTNKVISNLQSETLVLQGTEDILQKRYNDVCEFIETREERGGVKGYRQTKSRLEKTKETTAKVDELKGHTLQEISDMVQEMVKHVEEKRDKLQPMVSVLISFWIKDDFETWTVAKLFSLFLMINTKINELKQTRSVFQKLERQHDEKKNRYDKLATKLAHDRHYLENECNILQEEWLMEERQFHFVMNANDIIRVKLNKLHMEEMWRRGDQKMLPEFNCLLSLYNNKLTHLENLAKQLRKEQKMLTENEVENMKQVCHFSKHTLSFKRPLFC